MISVMSPVSQCAIVGLHRFDEIGDQIKWIGSPINFTQVGYIMSMGVLVQKRSGDELTKWGGVCRHSTI